MNSKIKAFAVGGVIGLVTHVLTPKPALGRAQRRRRGVQFKRDMYVHQDSRCAACKREHDIRLMEIDHITPIASGGTDHDSNLQLLCRKCNRAKGKKPINNFQIA